MNNVICTHWNKYSLVFGQSALICPIFNALSFKFLESRMLFERFVFKGSLIKSLGLFVVLNLIVGCGGNNGDTLNPESLVFDDDLSIEENVDNYINALVSSESSGIAIGVVNQGELLLSKGYGLANIDKNTPISTATPFYLASVSKQFFAMGIILLEERGLISVDDSAKMYFPEFPSSWSNITIHQLLSHQSGIPDYFRALAGEDLTDITNAQILERAVKTGLDFTPGSEFSYSNTGYVILSMLIERVSQSPIEIFMADNIFAAAGMSNTLIYDESKPDIPERAIGYSVGGGLRDYNILTTGDGGIFSTVEDLLLWSSALDNYSIVEQSTFEPAITPYRNDYGYGWYISFASLNSDRIISHSGGLAGFRTLIVKLQGSDMTIVTLSNGELNWLADLSNKIIAFLL
jgi:CubicO group peptidase (beta-lactamase class C family)